MTARHTVKLTAHFERNLEALSAFCAEAQAPQGFDALPDELTDTVIPNLERFPGLGWPILERPARSVEAADGIARLTEPLALLASDGELREYVLTPHLLLYARIQGTVVLLSIRHRRQLSFDFEALWGRRGPQST